MYVYKGRLRLSEYNINTINIQNINMNVSDTIYFSRRYTRNDEYSN